MRKQRYQRSVAQNKDPARVNTDTSDQDAQLLKTQLQGLKMIWADDEEEEEIKRGDNYNSIDQDMKDASSEVQSISAKGEKAHPELSEELHRSINGDKVMMAEAKKEYIINKYGEDAYANYVGYSYKNQPLVDKKANATKFIASIPADKYSDKFLSERDFDLKKYFTDTEITEIHVGKYTAKAKDFIVSTPITDANVGKVTEQLATRIDMANLPKKQRVMLKETLATKISKFKDAKLKQFNRNSEQIESDYLAGKISSIEDYANLNDSGAKSVGNAMYVKKQQALQENSISFRQFMNTPKGVRADNVFVAKRDSFIKSEYQAIKGVSADESNSYLLRPVDAIPSDKVMAVELLYNYYDEKKRDNPEFTLDNARDELYSGGTNATDAQKLIEDTFRRYTEIGLDKKQYVNLLKTTSGRQELLRLSAEKNMSIRIPTPSEDDNYEPRSRSEQPRTN